MSFSEGKKLHTDECYVCIISFIRSVLALTLAMAFLMVLALLTPLCTSANLFIGVSRLMNKPLNQFSQNSIE